VEFASSHMLAYLQRMDVLSQAHQFFHYCLTELLNNAFQHAMAQTNPLTCAQVWRGSRMQGQIAVVGCGIGPRKRSA
jgi:hypothetical protein